MPKRKTPISANWLALRKTLHKVGGASGERDRVPGDGGKKRRTEKGRDDDEALRKMVKREFGLENVVALDCEMVTVDRDGNKRVLAARVAIVDGLGDVLMDSYADPGFPVLDYHTRYSGIRAHHLKTAPLLSNLRPKVERLLAGKIVAGHAVHNDFDALGIVHPAELIRDTSKYPPLMVGSNGEKLSRGAALRLLAKRQLHMDIQHGAHNPVEDARAALYLYHNHREPGVGGDAAVR